MPDRRGAPGQGGSRRLLLLLVLISLVSASGCAQRGEAEGTALPLAIQAGEAPQHSGSQRVDIATPEPPSTGAPSSSALPERPDHGPPLSPAADATPAPATPVGLRIPAIGLDSDLVELGLEADGTLEVPSNGFPAGWYRGSPRPGEIGPAVIAGHVDWGGHPGVFFDLRNLSQGDDILVTRQDDSVVRFEITRVERFAKSGFPTSQVYGDLDHAGLRLITCGGEFNPDRRSYDDNLIVFAELAGADDLGGR